MSALREIAAHFGVTFDDSALAKGGAQLDGMVEKLKGVASSLGAAFAVKEVYEFVTGMTEQADALAKQSDAMGLSLAEMQEWQYAAMMQGVSAEQLTGVLTKLGSGKFDKGLAGLGVKSKDASGQMRNSTDVLEDVAEALKSIDNPAERNRKAVAVLGRSYAKMLPLMADGADGIRELRNEFQELGGGFTDDFAKQSDEFGDNIDRVKTLWRNLTITLVNKVLPTFLKWSKAAINAAKPIVALITHGKLFEAVLSGLAIRGVVFLSNKIGPLLPLLKLLARNFFGIVVPLLLLEDLLVFLAGGDSLIGRMLEKAFGPGSARLVRTFFTDLETQSKAAMDPKAGLGANLVATGLLMANVFKQAGVNADEFYRVVDGVWRGIVLGASIAWETLRKGWMMVGAAMADALLDPKLKAKNAEIDAQIAKNKKDWETGVFGGMSREQLDAFNAKLAATKEKSYTEQEDAESARRAKALVDEYDRLAVQLDPRLHTPAAIAERTVRDAGITGPGALPGTVSTTVNVTVPPGTPEQQANAVGKAAANGANQGLKAAHVALVPGGPGGKR